MNLTIPPTNLTGLRVELARLNRKAARLGLPPMEITSVSEELVDDDGFATVEVEIAGAVPSFSGWSFGGVAERLESGKTIFHGPRSAEVPERFQTLGNCCEHCGHKRNRSHVYAVAHEDGTWLQVGRSCIKDFLGGVSLAAFCWEPVAELREFEEESTRSHRASCIHVASVIGCAVQQVREHGFVPARSLDITSTADRVRGALREGPRTPEEDSAKGAVIKSFFAGAEPRGNDYFDKLRDLCACAFVESRNLGILVSAVTAYDREQALIAERAATKQSNHVGAVGNRIDLVVTVARNITLPDYGYGESTLLIMHDADGNVFTWKSSRQFDTEEKETFAIRGTVKDHTDYKGTAQTVLTRCKISEQ
jgi:hypothetical protein